MPRGGRGFGMPVQPWMYACGFRSVVGVLQQLNTPQPRVNPLARNAVDPIAECIVEITPGNLLTFDVTAGTALIGLSRPLDNHVGELVRVNGMRNSNEAASIERYFTDVGSEEDTTIG